MNFIGTALQEHIPLLLLIVGIGFITLLAVINNSLSIIEKLSKFFGSKKSANAEANCSDGCPIKNKLQSDRDSAQRELQIVTARASGLETESEKLKGALRMLQREAQEKVSGRIGISEEELAELARQDKGSSA